VWRTSKRKKFVERPAPETETFTHVLPVIRNRGENHPNLRLPRFSVSSRAQVSHILSIRSIFQ
jgi:hypothetical protein